LAALAITFAFMAGVCAAQASAEHLQQVVQPYVDAQVFMGSILVAQNGKAAVQQRLRLG
jgi:hypothetical protein